MNMENLKLAFRFGFIILSCFLMLSCVFAVSVVIFGNPLNFSWHPDFWSGFLLGIAFFGSYYYGWVKE